MTTAAQLAKVAGLAYQSRKEYESAIVSYQTSKILQEKVGIDFTYLEASYKIAKCTKKQGNFQLAMNLFKSNVKDLVSQQDDENSYDLLVANMIEIADCYLATFRYAEAEKYLKEIHKQYIKEKKKFARVLTNEAW